MPHDVLVESARPTEVNENKWLTPAASGHVFNEIGKGMNSMTNPGELANRTNNLVDQNVLPSMSIHNEKIPAPGDKVILHFGGGKIETEIEIGKPLQGKPNPDAKPGEGYKGDHVGGGGGGQFRPGLPSDLKEYKPTSGICDIPGMDYTEPCIIDTLLNG